jgi:hypothetical protein
MCWLLKPKRTLFGISSYSTSKAKRLTQSGLCQRDDDRGGRIDIDRESTVIQW